MLSHWTARSPVHCIMKYSRVYQPQRMGFQPFVTTHISLFWLFCDCFWWVGMRSHSWDASFSTLQVLHRPLSAQFSSATALLLYNLGLSSINLHAFYAFISYWYFTCCCKLCRHFALKMYSNICDPNYKWTLTIQHSLCWRQLTITRRLQLYFLANLVICCTLCDEGGTGAG
jgi:hypothetical protein